MGGWGLCVMLIEVHLWKTKARTVVSNKKRHSVRKIEKQSNSTSIFQPVTTLDWQINTLCSLTDTAVSRNVTKCTRQVDTW